MNSPVLEVDRVVKRYDTHVAVDGVGFQLNAGRILGLLGPNGAGKTTTLRMVMDIVAPDEGTIRFFGAPRTPDTNQRIGYLPEERGLYRRMTVNDHLIFLARLKGLEPRESRPRIQAWLERLELAQWLTHKIEELSKGMQQMVQFVGAVIHEPPLLILDEPFSGLDPIHANTLKRFIAEAPARSGTAIIFSTHIMEHAEKLCNDICLVNRGRRIVYGPIDEVKAARRTPAFLLRGADAAVLRGLPGVRATEPAGDFVRVRLVDDAASAAFLKAAVSAATISEFRADEPDLEAIFLSAVREAGAAS